MQTDDEADVGYRAWLRCVAIASGVVAGVLVTLYFVRSPSQTDEPRALLDFSFAHYRAVREKKPLLIYFASVNSTNARDVEVLTFSRPDIQALFRKYIMVWLYIDHVPDAKLSASQNRKEAEANLRMMELLTDVFTCPGLVKFEPEGVIPLDANGKPNGKTLGILGGYILRDASEVTRFLSETK